MLDIGDIIKTALSEHEGETSFSSPDERNSFIKTIESALEGDLNEVPRYSHASKPLSLVRFSCMLQDTGYPMEVYLPGESAETAGPSDSQWRNLKERWVGWAVELPGATAWATKAGNVLTNGLSSIHLNGSTPTAHPPILQAKYPLPDLKTDYLGALIKVYGEASFKPASTHTIIGILSTAVLPSPLAASESDEPVVVPCIHVIKGPLPALPPVSPVSEPEAIRTALLERLGDCFDPPDLLAAEYILLALLASPSIRPPALPPLGTLSLNLIGPSTSTSRLSATLRDLVPYLVNIPLTIPLLHSTSFSPSSADSASLDSGVLQLPETTVVLVDESGMGEGGNLEEKAVKNLQALTECMGEQKVRYEYPYMEGLKMDTILRPIVLSEGKSLIPVDINLPVLDSTSGPSGSQSGLGPSAAASSSTRIAQSSNANSEEGVSMRSYLQTYGSVEHARRLSIPDATANLIQDDFVAHRQRSSTMTNGTAARPSDGVALSGDAETMLKRRMKIARLVAVSYPDAVLTEERWKWVVQMDEEAIQRMAARKVGSREPRA